MRHRAVLFQPARQKPRERRRAGWGPVPAVAAVLGHASVATTGTYAKAAEKIKSNPTAYLEAMLEELED